MTDISKNFLKWQREKLRTLSLWRIVWVSLIASVFFATAIVSIMSLILHDEVRRDFLITGAVTSFIVALIIVSVITILIKLLRDADRLLIQKTVYLDNILRSSMDMAIVATDLGLKITYFSQAAEELFGYKAGDVIDRTVKEVHDWENIDLSRLEKAIDQVHSAGVYKHCFKQEKEGVARYLDYRVSGIWDKNKELVGFVLMARDITAPKRAEESLRLAASVIENATEGVIVTDSGGVIQSVNPAFTTITGYSREEAIGQKPSILKSGKHDKEYYKNLWDSLLETGRWHGEIWNRSKNGETYLEQVTITAIKNANGETTQYAAMFNDITEVKRSEEEIKYQAYHDLLTGLPNRVLFNNRVKEAITRARRENWRLAVLFLDLDNFKKINDGLGHHVGDLVLKGAAMRLIGCLREVDTVSRFSGDEFLIYLENLKRDEDAAVAAQKVIDALSEPFVFKGEELVVTISVGIAIYPSDGKDSEELIKNADLAMYQAKKEGKNNYQSFDPAMNEKAQRRQNLERQIKRGIDNDEFIAYYQPRVDITTGDIVGMEALVRWRRADGSIIPPDEFIPLAEEMGLIMPIGERILLEACCHTSKWHGMGFSNLTVSVNLSARQLDQKNLLEVVRSTLDIAELKPEYLCLELTESSLMKNLEAALTILDKLKETGVKISMDDFGTGYSSLSHLKKFPIYELKIDRSFVLNIPDDPDSSAITEAIISMADTLNLHVVAEGVETQAQLDFLRSTGCKEMQGFLFSPPLTKVKMEKMLMEKKSLSYI